MSLLSLKNVKQFREFIGPEVWFYFLFSILLGVLLFLIELSFIYVIQGFFLTIGLISAEQANLPTWFPKTSEYSIALFLLFGIGRSLLYMFKQYMGGVISQAFMQRQREKIIEIALKNGEAVDTPEVLNVFLERVSSAGSVLQAISQVILMGFCGLFIFILGLRIAYQEMLISIALLGLFTFPLSFFNGFIKRSGSFTRKQSDKMSEIIILGLKHNFFLRIYDLLEKDIEEAIKALRSYRSNYQKYFFVSSVRTYFPNIVGITILCLITIVAKKISKEMDAIQFISFFYLFMRFAQAASDINTNISEIRLHQGAFIQTYEWVNNLNLLAKNTSTPISEEKIISINEIKVQDLSFGYSSHKLLFQNLSFKLMIGDVLLIKGKSGAGKSTLLKILTGLENPTSGKIFVNNHSLLEVGKGFRELIGYVGPESYIINGSIRSNLLYGQKKLNFSDHEFYDALEKVHLGSEISGLDYVINDLTGMSTGQKQRLSLARAFLRKPKLLVLDEATANLDHDTENKILQDLKKVSKDLILIIISHKPAFDEMATVRVDL